MRFFYSFIALFFLSLCLPSLASADNSGWELTHEAEPPYGIVTWKKSFDNKPMDDFRGQITVPYSMLTILAVMADIGHYKEWVFQCDDAKFLPKVGPTYSYIYIDGIWPVSDRDGVLVSTLSQDPKTLALTIHTVAAPDKLPEEKGVVRIPMLDNTFTLFPISPTETRITFTTSVDPGGLIPAWLANFVAVQAPYETLYDMRERMDMPKYQIDSINDLPVIFPHFKRIRLPGASHRNTVNKAAPHSLQPTPQPKAAS